jgi:hypothetical protein
MSFESAPFLSNEPNVDDHDPSQVPFRVSHNTPLLHNLVAFSKCAEALDIYPATASILDDMRFLISTVLSLPPAPTEVQLAKLQSTSAWIYERISNLPEQSPVLFNRPTPSPVDPSVAADPAVFPSLKLAPPTTSLAVPAPSTRRSLSPHSAHSPRLVAEGYLSGDERTSKSPRLGVKHRSSEPGRSRQRSSSRASRHPSPAASHETEIADYLYQAVRKAALIWSQAGMLRRPFSAVVDPATFNSLWLTMWRVPLSKWKALVGVFNWALISILPSARGTPNDRFVKSMVNISVVQMGLDGWEMTSGAMRAALRFQAWLREGARQEKASMRGPMQPQMQSQLPPVGSPPQAGPSARLDVGAGRRVGSYEEELATARQGKRPDGGGADADADADPMDLEMPIHPQTW